MSRRATGEKRAAGRELEQQERREAETETEQEQEKRLLCEGAGRLY